MAASLAQGFLKQQTVDDSGLFAWSRRFFRLSHEGDLHGSASELAAQPDTSVSVLGIRLAREWRVSSPAAGYGFDVVWPSGRVWSFLSDSADTTRTWVAAFNALAQRTAEDRADETITVAQSPLRASADRRANGDTPLKLGPSAELPRPTPAAPANLHQSAAHDESAALTKRVQELEQEVAEGTRRSEERLRAAEQSHRAEVDALREELAMQANQAAALSLQKALQTKVDRLQEELAAQVKRNHTLEERLSNRCDRSELKESRLREELSALAERFRGTQESMSGLGEEHEAEMRRLAEDFRRESTKLRNRISALESDLARATEVREELVQRRVQEAEERFRDAQNRVEEEVRVAVRREVEGAHMRELAAMQRKCSSDVAQAVAEEKKLAASQVETVRAGFVQREKELAADVKRLEELHGRRAGKLETQLAEAKAEQQRLSSALQELKEGEERRIQEMRKQVESRHASAVSQAAQVSELNTQLASLQRLVQESRVREQSYRDQLSQSMEENKALRYEIAEVRRHATDGSYQTHQWRNLMRELELSKATVESCLHIAQDEVKMLENELSRLKDENHDLRDIINRSDNIIYGKAKRSASLGRNKENGGGVANSATLGGTNRTRRDML